MSYFKGIGAIPQQSAAPVAAKVITPGTKSFSDTKAAWPRCGVTVRDSRTGELRQGLGYLYTFKDGTKLCSPVWDQNLYAMQVRGEVPKKSDPDLSRVAVGSPEYFTWLCKAQGPASDPEVASIRRGFEKANLEWKPSGDSKMRKLSPPYDDSSRLKVKVDSRNVQPCSTYLKKYGNSNAWRNHAYHYSINLQGKQTQNISEYRPSECAKHVPPALVPACEAALARKDGTSIQDFLDALKDMDPNQVQSLVDETGRTSLSPVVYYGAAAAVVAVAALLLSKRK